MKCHNCGSELKKIKVKVERAKNPVISHQGTNCDYFEFEKESSKKVTKELRETH